MKASENMDQLLKRLDELKNLFGSGIKLIPIIEKLIDFMKEMIPLMDNISHSIEESTAKIPKASSQISKVTEATEMATTEILDIVDRMSSDISNSAEMIRNELEIEKQKSEIIRKIKSLVPAGSEIMNLIRQYEKAENENKEIVRLIDYLQKIKEDAYNITMSLQVQDITSQQLSAVKHLIGSVQTKLASLNTNLNEADLKNMEIKVIAEHSFDPNANYSKSDGRQKMADSIINSINNTSQSEVDKLFS